ncbi:uncharacterized protein LOC118749427 [Rhagoletis pomonella]|uniref:uncharacterized protein LOC118749427 n=1 Tax=Rhagoletis pomonella TaxID=28610 RepID=UPI001780779C|nr:uncharacterized protein LOC118749427 [Rhagoletis pomonella]
MTSLYTIDKLEESSYETWLVQMRSVLIHGGLWKVVTGTKPSNAEELTLWTVNDEKALATILLSVKPNQLNYVKNCKREYCGVSQCFYGNKLAEIGIVIQEELLSIILLSSLPKSFENFFVAIETRDSLPSLSTLKLKILEEGERRKRQNESSDEGGQQTFIAREHDKKQKKKFNGKCFACGKKGHFANKCKEKQKGGEAAMNVIATANTLTSFDRSCQRGDFAHEQQQKFVCKVRRV